MLHWCRPTRIWIWTSGGSGLISPSLLDLVDLDLSRLLLDRASRLLSLLSGSQPTSARYPDLSRLLCYLAAIQLFLHRLHDCHLCNCDPCLCTTVTDSSTFSKPAQHIQQTGICQTGTPLPSTRGHLTDIACMPVQLDAAAVYGASPLSPVLPSPSPRQPLTAAAPCRCPTPIISELSAQHPRRSPFQQKGFVHPPSPILQKKTPPTHHHQLSSLHRTSGTHQTTAP